MTTQTARPPWVDQQIQSLFVVHLFALGPVDQQPIHQFSNQVLRLAQEPNNHDHNTRKKAVCLLQTLTSIITRPAEQNGLKKIQDIYGKINVPPKNIFQELLAARPIFVCPINHVCLKNGEMGSFRQCLRLKSNFLHQNRGRL